MRITKKMIAEGWKQDKTSGEWIAPDKTGVRCATYDANGKKRVELNEAKVNLGGHHDEDSGYTPPPKREVEDAQLLAYQRVGLSRAEAIRAVDLGNGKARFNKG